jgi:hypothetical protein
VSPSSGGLETAGVATGLSHIQLDNPSNPLILPIRYGTERREKMASVQRLRRMPRVEIVDDERSLGNGIIVTLKRGYTFSFGEDNRVCGFDNIHDAADRVKEAISFDGPFDQ